VPYQVQLTTLAKTGAGWEFPPAGRYRFPGARIRPYLEAGLCFNHLTGVFAPFRTLVSQSATLQPGIRSVDRRGIVVGGGLKFKLPFVRLTPGLRYSRFGGSEASLSSANAIDFLVGLTF